MFAVLASALVLMSAQSSAPTTAETAAPPASPAAPAAPPVSSPPAPDPDLFVNPVTPESLALGRILAKRALPEDTWGAAASYLAHMIAFLDEHPSPNDSDPLWQTQNKHFIAAIKELSPSFNEEILRECSLLYAQRLTVKEMKEEIEFYNGPYGRMADVKNPLSAGEQDALAQRLSKATMPELEKIDRYMKFYFSADQDVMHKYFKWLQNDFDPRAQGKVIERYCFHLTEGNDVAYRSCMMRMAAFAHP